MDFPTQISSLKIPLNYFFVNTYQTAKPNDESHNRNYQGVINWTCNGSTWDRVGECVRIISVLLKYIWHLDRGSSKPFKISIAQNQLGLVKSGGQMLKCAQIAAKKQENRDDGLRTRSRSV